MKEWLDNNRAWVCLVVFLLSVFLFLLGCCTLIWTFENGNIVLNGKVDNIIARLIVVGFFGLFGFVLLYRGLNVIADPNYSYNVSTYRNNFVEIDGTEHIVSQRTGSQKVQHNFKGGLVLSLIGFLIIFGATLSGFFLP